MGSWFENPAKHIYRYLPPIYSRDFAYANNAPVVLRMARANIGDTSAKIFAELLSGPTLDFYVGPEKRHWSLHRNLLCHHSPYFEAEFLGHEASKSSKRSGETKIDLPEQHPAGFELLVKWLYQGSLDDLSDMSDEKKYEYSVACHKLYLLCDRFDLPILKNVSIDCYRQGLLEAQLVPDAEEINEIYRRSPVGSPFRKLMSQIAARQIMDPDTDKDAESYRNCFKDNPDFAVDMVNAIKAGTGGMLFEDPTDGDECNYHEQGGCENCRVNGKGPASRSMPTSPRKRTPPSPAVDMATNTNGHLPNGTQPQRSGGGGQPAARPSARPCPPTIIGGGGGRHGLGRLNGANGVHAKGQNTGGRTSPRSSDSGKETSGGESPPRRKPKKLVIRGSPAFTQGQKSP